MHQAARQGQVSVGYLTCFTGKVWNLTHNPMQLSVLFLNSPRISQLLVNLIYPDYLS